MVKINAPIKNGCVFLQLHAVCVYSFTTAFFAFFAKLGLYSQAGVFV